VARDNNAKQLRANVRSSERGDFFIGRFSNSKRGYFSGANRALFNRGLDLGGACIGATFVLFAAGAPDSADAARHPPRSFWLVLLWNPNPSVLILVTGEKSASRSG
jgi:hypothetical protein